MAAAAGLSSAAVDWANLSFDVTETRGRAQAVWRDGVWSDVTFEEGPYLQLHMFANVLHYGQEVFEGLKAYHCRDGQVRTFNDKANWERMQNGSRRMKIAEMPYEIFQKAIDLAVQNNRAYIPPPEFCEKGAALYIRPVIIGSGAQVGLHPSKEFIFMVMVVPVGPYFKDGFKAIPGEVVSDYDRAAPQGVGAVKCAGNYAADLHPQGEHKGRGFPIGLYLDPKEKKYCEEFNGANLIAITKDGRYVTPESESILPSITNKCLIQLATDRGMPVARERLEFDSAVGAWAEVGAVGTAAVICPIKSLQRGDQVHSFSEEAPKLKELYDDLTSIQRGEAEDKHGWTRIIGMP
jgi:branched-chain amino acid aminotransferase